MSLRNLLGSFFIRLGTRLLQLDNIDKDSFIDGDYILLPKLPYDDGKVLEVAVKEGDAVLTDELLIAIEYEHLTLDIPCPCHCLIKDILVRPDEVLSEGQRLFKIRTLE